MTLSARQLERLERETAAAARALFAALREPDPVMQQLVDFDRAANAALDAVSALLRLEEPAGPLAGEMTDADRAWCRTVIVAGSHEAKYSTWELTKRVLDEGVPGDFAECGVFAGGHPIVVDHVLRRAGDRLRRVHLFDSFQGIPRASLEDFEHERRVLGLRARPDELVSSGVSCASLEEVRCRMRVWGAELSRVFFHPGWFEETLAKDAEAVGPLAFLRVDVDLYTSARPVWAHLYDKVVSGGVVVDDDYGEVEEVVTPTRRALFEFFDGRGLPRPAVTRVPGNVGTAWWRKP